MEINEQKLKKILGDQREEYQRYLGILQEDFGSKVELIAEQHTNIKQALNSHTEMIGEMKEDMTEMKGEIVEIKGDITDIKEDIGDIKDTK